MGMAEQNNHSQAGRRRASASGAPIDQAPRPVGQVLQVEGLLKSYASGGPGGLRREVLRGVDLEARPGEIVGIVGSSGCGKSTLLNIIGGLEAADGGSVRLGQLRVTELDGAELARYRGRQVGFVFQDHHLLDQCTVLENVLLPALAAGQVERAGPRAGDLLERVGLADRSGDLPHRLSGGERQRVALVRGLINEPQLLLCDEPTGNLDSATGREMVSLLVELVQQRQAAALLVTHNLELSEFFSRCLRLRDGRLEQA